MTSAGTSPHGPGRFFRAAAAWTISIAGFWALAVAATADGTWPLADFIEILAMALAFSAFPGGVASPMLSHRSRWEAGITCGAALVTSACVYGLLAYAAPWVDLWVGTFAGPESPLTNGAMTPAELHVLRARLMENSTLIVESRASASDPFLWAPNWVDYKLVHPRAVGILTLVNAGLGVLCATLTIDLRPGIRRRLRWCAGLASALVFLILDGAVSSVIAADATVSALVWIGVSIAPHLVALALLGLALRLTSLDRHTPIQRGRP